MQDGLRSLIIKYLKGKTNREESKKVDQYYDQLSSGNMEFNRLSKQEKAEMESRLYDQIQIGIAKSKIRKLKPDYRKWAAVLLLPLLIGSLYFSQRRQSTDENLLQRKPGSISANLITSSGKSYSLSSPEDLINLQAAGLYQEVETSESPVQMHEINTPKGGFYQLILPDSSLVWLNAASSIRFPSRFDEDKREVVLVGEGYFEIKHNANAPFFVKTANQTTRVLGTKFNINAYSNQIEDEVTLIEGSVEARSLSQEAIIMKPGHRASIGTQITYQQVDQASDYAAWRSGDFYFDNFSMSQVLQMLGRWYDLDVDVSSVPSNRINGLIPRNLLLKDVLALIETTSNVKISVSDGKLKVVK